MKLFLNSKASVVYFLVSAALNFSGAGQIFVQHIFSHLDVL